MTVREASVDELFSEMTEMMADAQDAPQPGADLVGTIVHSGDSDVPASIGVSRLESAGYVTVYHTETGEPSAVNRNLLPFQLNKRLPSGKRAFTTDRKKAPAVRQGKYRCLLHQDRREPWMDEEVLPTCAKANLTTVHQVRLHMQHRHKTEWQTIEARREEQEREEERAFRKALMLGSPPPAKDRR